MKAIFLPFALSLTCSFAANSSADDPHPDLLRVMTYNTWYVFAKGNEQTAGKAFVKSQTPDVVGLQELTDIKPAKLQELATAWEHPHSSLLKTSGFSVGLTSRWPVEVVEKRVSEMHHGYLHAKTNGVHYFVVHLSPFKWEVRSRESNIILKQVAGLLDAGNKVIVLGDFNAFTPDDRQWLLANKDLIPRMKESDQKHGHVENLKEGEIDYSVMKIFLDSGLSDTTERFISKSLKHRLTLPTGVWKDKETPPEKGQRIDFILASTNLFQRVKNSRIIREGAVNRISDHYPVITDFELN